MSVRRTPKPCACGATYAELRTGLTFAEVRRMMWRGDGETWRNKRRRGVLGFWREMKLQLWDQIHGGCFSE